MLANLLRRAWQAGKNEHIVLGLLAAAIGLVVGLAAIGFREGISLVQQLGFGFGHESVASGVASLPFWQVLLVPAVGGLVVGVMLRFATRDGRAHGVADVIEANALRDGRISFRTGLTSALIAATSIGAGASTGREGPIVHLGASLAEATTRWLHLSANLTRTVLACGVAAAVSASFNAPIAGVFFALEVVLGHYALRAFAPVVIASVAGTLVSRAYFGDFPAFTLPAMAIGPVTVFPAFLLLGVAAAAVAILFLVASRKTAELWQHVPLPRWLYPAIAGLLVGGVALAFPQILGVGYEATDQALNDSYTLQILLVLLVLKILATSLCLGAGFGGGVFSPSLFLGAMLGAAFGIVATSVVPDSGTSASVFAVAGMGAVAGAILGAPISTILIVFELLGDYKLALAVMLATAVAALITRQVARQSFFQQQLTQRGVDISSSAAMRSLARRPVTDMMISDISSASPDANLQTLRQALLVARPGFLMIVDDNGTLLGRVTPYDLRNAEANEGDQPPDRADQIMGGRGETLTANKTLDQAVNLFETSGEDHIAILSDDDDHRLLGLLPAREVLLAYNRALLAERRETQ